MTSKTSGKAMTGDQRVSPAALRRAFELGALAMRQLAEAKCGNLTESLEEGIMTDVGLTTAGKRAMSHQVNAIEEVRRDIARATPSKAAYYGSYIFEDAVQNEIKALFPDISETRGRDTLRSPVANSPSNEKAVVS